MAEAIIICPNCEKRFKGKEEMEGKKIRCPLCSEPFRVTQDMISLAKAAASKKKEVAAVAGKAKGPAKAEAPPPPPPSPPPPPPEPEKKNDDLDDLDADANPYEVKQEKFAVRCPNCAKELLNERDIVCVHCGYNNVTRERGITTRAYDVTFGEHVVHLLPAIGSLLFCLSVILALMWFSLVFPIGLQGWMQIFDSEPARLILTIIFLIMFIYPSGFFGIFKIINEPKPKEREKD
jgi:DNA-directed RNA polymerase subunit RPC12/RpoP